MEDLLEVRRALAFPQNIVILSHRNPDGDAIGSCLAWMQRKATPSTLIKFF